MSQIQQQLSVSAEQAPDAPADPPVDEDAEKEAAKAARKAARKAEKNGIDAALRAAEQRAAAAELESAELKQENAELKQEKAELKQKNAELEQIRTIQDSKLNQIRVVLAEEGHHDPAISKSTTARRKGGSKGGSKKEGLYDEIQVVQLLMQHQKLVCDRLEGHKIENFDQNKDKLTQTLLKEWIRSIRPNETMTWVDWARQFYKSLDLPDPNGDGGAQASAEAANGHEIDV